MKKYEETDGVWRTVRGRRIFIRKGEDLTSAMKRSGKFDNLKREDVQKAKKQLKVDEAKDKWNKEYDPKKYKNTDYQDEKKRELMKKRKERVNKNLENAYADRDDFMATYDDNRDENELSWQDKVAKNNREADKKAKEIFDKRGKDEYMFNDTKWQDDYYGTFREQEEKNARVKEEPDNAPYESVEAYKGFKEKADALDKTGKPWYGEVYTNDEFMEHLTDANWHTERKMIEEAGLTNKQLRELKKNVKLDRYGVDLDREKTQKLIDKVKKEFPSDEEKIKSFKEKKQSNNKNSKLPESVRRLNDEKPNHKVVEVDKTKYHEIGNGQWRSEKDGYDYYIDFNMKNKDNPRVRDVNTHKVIEDYKAKKQSNNKIAEEDIKMLESIYAYSDESPKGVENDKYYKEIVDKYGKETTDKAYKEITDNYVVKKGIYTDSEGVTYNTLEKKQSNNKGEEIVQGKQIAEIWDGKKQKEYIVVSYQKNYAKDGTVMTQNVKIDNATKENINNAITKEIESGYKNYKEYASDIYSAKRNLEKLNDNYTDTTLTTNRFIQNFLKNTKIKKDRNTRYIIEEYKRKKGK